MKSPSVNSHIVAHVVGVPLQPGVSLKQVQHSSAGRAAFRIRTHRECPFRDSKAHNGDAFRETKYGSARNNFFERNYGGLSVLSEGGSGLSSDFSLAARLNNFATSSMQSSDIYIMPVVGDLQPNFESISEAGTASASISASVRMREGIRKVELGIIAVNAASESISVSQPLGLQFVAQPDGTYKADNVSGVVVSYNPSTGRLPTSYSSTHT